MRERKREREREREADRQTHRHTDTQTHRDRNSHRHRETDRKTALEGAGIHIIVFSRKTTKVTKTQTTCDISCATTCFSRQRVTYHVQYSILTPC